MYELWYYNIALWENPYIGMSYQLFLFNAKVRIFPQSYVVLLSRVHNIYTEESILLSYTPVEGRIVKL